MLFGKCAHKNIHKIKWKSPDGVTKKKKKIKQTTTKKNKHNKQNKTKQTIKQTNRPLHNIPKVENNRMSEL